MPRSLWKGSISFGLVEIPVELLPAEKTEELSFTLVDKRDHSPVGYKRVNKNTGREVPWNEIVKGYEYEPEEFVLLSDKELKSANPEASRTIDILGFVDLAEIHPAYFDRPYYLRPTRSTGGKAYALLRETLERTGKVGLARVVIRTKAHLAALLTRGSALVLCLLRYAHELRDVKGLDLPAQEVKLHKQEIDLATRLVEGMSTRWDPKRFHDDYREDVLALIEKKVKAGQLEPLDVPEPKRPGKRGEVLDLMPLLQQSVEERTSRPSRSRSRRRTA